ncbi:MAG TPA: fatty acid--CoA ligase, partial [Acidimicrobiaceae bacterium]|nr:fatty acid--CoA ligase [Acidimicrobiaceae bacterium]
MTGPIPDNFPALVDRAAREFASTEAISDGETSLNFSELGQQIKQAAGALVASGVDRGDRVAVWAPNSWEWVVAAMAVFRVGAVLVPVNTRFKGREAAFVLEKANVKVLFTVVGFLGNDYVSDLRESGQQVESIEDVVVLRGDVVDGTISFEDFLARSSSETFAEAEDRAADVSGSDLGLIMFTSGTTGVPKGVMVEQGPIIRGFSHYARELGMRQGDRMLIVNPFFHAFGFNGAINPCFIHGATML